MNRPIASITQDLITDLHLSDEQTEGHPALPPDRVGLARECLEQLLLDPTRLQKHLSTLEGLYKAQFVAPSPRGWRQGNNLAPPQPAAAFRHSALLSDPLALAVMDGGVGRLPDADLAALLLNPYALWDLDDLIHSTLPDYWLDRMEEKGVQLAQESGIDLYEDFNRVVGTVKPTA
jgi:hypothetical protein